MAWTWEIYVYAGVLWFIQNASFTAVSRARNSGSDMYHALMAIPSNGIWYVSQFIMIGAVTSFIDGAHIWPQGVLLGIEYIICTVSGSVAAGHVLREYIEKGKRKVGHYEENKERLEAQEATLEKVVTDVDALYKKIYGEGF